MPENESPRRPSITWSRIIRPGEQVDHEAGDVDYWVRLSPGDRMVEAWRLSEEVWEWVQNKEPNEPGLPRSVVSLSRR